MLSRSNRFHGHHAVSRVKGRSVHGVHLSIRSSKNNQPSFRMAVVVSKKTAAHAVARNRIRRRIFEAVRRQGRLNGVGVDIVFYAKTEDIATLPVDTLNREIEDLTKQALRSLHS